MSIRVVTWNMQGGGPGAGKWLSDVSRLFTQAEADIACLQECGSVPQAAVPQQTQSLKQPYPCGVFSWNPGTPKKQQQQQLQLGILWLKTRMGGNLAIVGPPSLFTPAPFVPLLVSSGDSGLLALGISVRTAQGSAVSLYTSNTFFASGPDDPALLEQIVAVQGAAPWFVVGDFNQEPMDWVWNQDVVPSGVVYCGHAPVSTSPGAGTNLDYGFLGPQSAWSGSTATGHSFQSAFAQQTPAPSGQQPAVPTSIDTTYDSSDHFPVFYELPFDMASQ